MKGTVVNERPRLVEVEREGIVGVEARRLEGWRSIVGGNRLHLEISIGPSDGRAHRDSERTGREHVVVDRHVSRLDGLGHACRPRLMAPWIHPKCEAGT